MLYGAGEKNLKKNRSVCITHTYWHRAVIRECIFVDRSHDPDQTDVTGTSSQGSLSRSSRRGSTPPPTTARTRAHDTLNFATFPLTAFARPRKTEQCRSVKRLDFYSRLVLSRTRRSRGRCRFLFLFFGVLSRKTRLLSRRVRGL